MGTFVLEIPRDPTAKELAAIQQMMDASAESHNREVQRVMAEEGVDQNCAGDVVYLRTRLRHTPELERRLIELHKEGTPPNIMEWC
jgi:hypothetical protein